MTGVQTCALPICFPVTIEIDGLRKDFDAVKGQLKSVDEKISKSADTGSKKFDEMGNQVQVGRI